MFNIECQIVNYLPLELREMIQVECRPNECDERKDNHHASYYLIYKKDAIDIELAPNLIDEPSEAKPPKQRTEDNAQVAHAHLQRHIWHNKSKLGKGGHEKKDDERITQRNQESRNAVVQKRTLLATRLVHILHRIALEAIDSECKQHQATENLQVELVLRIIHKIHHKAHPQARKQCIHHVAARCSYACDETIPTPLVQSALYTQDAYWPHWGRGNHSYDNSLEDEVKDIYLYRKCYTHNSGQRYKNSGTSHNFFP